MLVQYPQARRRHLTDGSDRPGAHRVTVLVCGEPERGDDAVAFAAIEALPEAARAVADVVRCGRLDVEHLLDVPDGIGCVVVDAAVGVAPGEVVVIPLTAIAERSAGGSPRSSHTLPPDQVIALAAALRGRPPQGVFVGIGGEAFGLGAGLSSAVRSSLPLLVETLAREVVRLAAEAWPEG
jgi:hydrogenase maturation protease